jgi:hypothetical protein
LIAGSVYAGRASLMGQRQVSVSVSVPPFKSITLATAIPSESFSPSCTV